ncbi:hypothetical protein BD779DRAFT_1475660 [Infundibulicybe gibba]|nr:hypothetical protein BD779DRAFT_1475660 [Infundibulicybe gibba]
MPAAACLHKLWLVFDLSDRKWAPFSKFTFSLQVSHQAARLGSLGRVILGVRDQRKLMAGDGERNGENWWLIERWSWGFKEGFLYGSKESYANAWVGLGVVSIWEFWVRLEVVGWDCLRTEVATLTFAALCAPQFLTQKPSPKNMVQWKSSAAKFLTYLVGGGRELSGRAVAHRYLIQNIAGVMIRTRIPKPHSAKMSALGCTYGSALPSASRHEKAECPRHRYMSAGLAMTSAPGDLLSSDRNGP